MMVSSLRKNDNNLYHVLVSVIIVVFQQQEVSVLENQGEAQITLVLGNQAALENPVFVYVTTEDASANGTTKQKRNFIPLITAQLCLSSWI